MHVAIPILMMLVFGKASFGAMTALDWAMFGLQNAPQIIKTERQLIAFMQTPQFRAWAARNGEEAIRLRPGISTER